MLLVVLFSFTFAAASSKSQVLRPLRGLQQAGAQCVSQAGEENTGKRSRTALETSNNENLGNKI